MKKVLLFSFLMIMMVNYSFAQRYEIGLFAGGNNIIGDVGTNLYVSPSTASPTIGGLFKWNVDERFAFRVNFYASLAYQYGEEGFEGINNGYEYRTGIANLDVLAEWSIFDFDLRRRNAHSPFLFVGVGGLSFNKITKKLDSNGNWTGNYVDDGKGTTLAIPFGVGYKWAISYKWVVGTDLTFRYSFTDDLDYSVTKNIGNFNSNDWLTTVGVTLTYYFGRDPCACGQ